MAKQIKIQYPAYVSWKIDLTGQTNPLFPFSKKGRKRINATEKILPDHEYSFVIEPVDTAYITRFTKIYDSFIKKIQGKHYDLHDAILINPPHRYPYFSISLYKGNKLHGGMIFSHKDNCLSVAMRVFPHQITPPPPIALSYVAEKILNTYALEHSLKYIIHGTGRNAFGKDISIGLADYKLRIGANPYLSEKYKHKKPIEYYEWNEKDDAYVLLWPEKADKIAHAVILSNKNEQDIRSKYPKLFSTEAPTVTFKH